MSLAVAEPGIASEWHPEKNGGWTPASIAQKSNLYAWWRCAEGHEWRTRINNRVAGRLGCPECFESGLSAKKASLAKTHQAVAAQWHPVKNGRLAPDDVVASSQRLVWWRCPLEHAWQATPHSRSTTRNGCPDCYEEDIVYVDGLSKVDAGLRQDSIAVLYPELAAEWNVELNGGTLATEVSANSDIRRWWTCATCSQDFTATPSRRAADPRCTKCSRRHRDTRGTFAEEYPALVAFWDTKKNGASPKKVRTVLAKKYWWKCPEGHSWEQLLSNRVSYGPRCAVCSGRHLVPGVNDLATLNPTAAAHWHPTKNGDLAPMQVSPGTLRRAWWLCPDGHEWEAEIRSWKGGRTGYAGCWVCRDQAAATQRAEKDTARRAYRLHRAQRPAGHQMPVALAAQWHPALNDEAWPGGPTTASTYSRRSAFWLCECGHSWEAFVGKRAALGGAGGLCPSCKAHWNWERPLSADPLPEERHPLARLIKQGLTLATADRLAIVGGFTSVDEVVSVARRDPALLGLGTARNQSVVEAVRRVSALNGDGAQRAS